MSEKKGKLSLSALCQFLRVSICQVQEVGRALFKSYTLSQVLFRIHTELLSSTQLAVFPIKFQRSKAKMLLVVSNS